MAKTGPIGKLKSVLKKWNSFTKLQSRPNLTSGSSHSAVIDTDLHPVYVGKSRRRYLLTSDTIEHPLIRELSERCGGGRGGDQSSPDQSINVACEVVLFEHLLWMLENTDPPPESLDELVDFYAC